MTGCELVMVVTVTMQRGQPSALRVRRACLEQVYRDARRVGAVVVDARAKRWVFVKASSGLKVISR